MDVGLTTEIHVDHSPLEPSRSCFLLEDRYVAGCAGARSFDLTPSAHRRPGMNVLLYSSTTIFLLSPFSPRWYRVGNRKHVNDGTAAAINGAGRKENQ